MHHCCFVTCGLRQAICLASSSRCVRGGRSAHIASIHHQESHSLIIYQYANYENEIKDWV
ncbi:hypothetical protein BGZ60DRAFT_396961 [Tricladium varicosporioides]|nr:hypothetical protein BGZ60DRAFT_396961 [Hymenoscyphus varicosporioides]